jgi:hypothetical protein
MRGMSSFVITTILVGVLCAVSFMYLVHVYLGRPPEKAIGAAIGGQAGDLVSLLSFIVGTAATAGGAIASVILSNIALRLSLEAEKRETSTFAADRIDNAAAHFSRIASGMNRLYAATALVEDKARFYERQYVYGMTGLSAHEQDRLNRELAGPCAQVADALDTMAAALDEALCDEFARYALVKGMELQAATGRLPRTKDAMARLPQAGRTPSLLDLPEIVAILRSAAFSMREDARSIVVNAWRWLPEDLKVSPDSHVMVERPAVDFILMGNMTDLRSGQLTEAGGAYCVRTGYALLADLAHGLPTPETILDALFERYESALPKRSRLSVPIHFDPKRALSMALLEGAADAASVPDALAIVVSPHGAGE